jgi:formylglycine-generating enzyme required for sulfatase activity/tRNA A-37 threonylcarbamoyl transferase component Bud32
MSSAADPTAAFLAAIKASNMLSAQQLQQMERWASESRADVQGIAKELSRLGWLSAFQIKEIFKGRGKDLTLGQYILLDLLGEGGMGRVFKVKNTRLGRIEALKVIRKEKLKHPSAEARFQTEMEALGKVTHPNVVTAYDAGPLGDTLFVSMEFIDGADLTRMVRERGPLPLVAACEYIRQGAIGLHHAFEKGMVHRDIKPSNLLVTRDGRTVKLVDLGLARLEEAGSEGGNRITQEGFVIGTPDFLAPEQARDPGKVDIRADIYALGATLFYILTGKVPFDGGNPTEKLVRHCTEPPPKLLPLRPDAPPQLEQIIHWCMSKRAEDRPQTPMKLAQVLQPFCTVPTSGPHPVASKPTAVISGSQPVATVQAALAQVPATDPNPSSQIFKLPSRSNNEDPIRRRAEGGFPIGYLLIGLGALLVLAVLGYAAYRVLRVDGETPLETFENSAGMRMIKLDGGTFRMGSPDDEPGRNADEGPVHEITIRGPFFMAEKEVTHQQFINIMGRAPSKSASFAKNPTELPVDSVTYSEAIDFCKKLTDKEKKEKYARKGWEYRLPTEAEWEFACRAGKSTHYTFGDKLVHRAKERDETMAYYTPTGDPNDEALEGVSLPPVNPYLFPSTVGHYKPNAWGFYDMHGNVAEWCLDWYARNYPAEGPETGTRRVIRGGSFKDGAVLCRSAARQSRRPEERSEMVGFRVVYAPKN